MPYSLSNICTENCWNPTTTVKAGLYTFFQTQCTKVRQSNLSNGTSFQLYFSDIHSEVQLDLYHAK